MYRLYINPKEKSGHIHKELQGHFSEHLGRCIYEGIYVGENSPIPNENGMRKDVVKALREMFRSAVTYSRYLLLRAIIGGTMVMVMRIHPATTTHP